MDLHAIDFYDICRYEGVPFYSDISSINRENFNKWVRENIEELGTIESFDRVIPNSKFISELEELGYEHSHYQCHYSAKAVTILKEDYVHYTGFVKRPCSIFPIITHSFNYREGVINDFSRIQRSSDPFTEMELKFPQTYYGIKIHREFVMKYKDETLSKRSMHPLLIDWYSENS